MEDKNKYIPFAQTVDIKIKEKIWHLYFDKLYSYPRIEEYFRKKYTYAQIKSIINERYKQYGKTN